MKFSSKYRHGRLAIAHFLAIPVFLLFAELPLLASTSTNHFVFAHYMVCYADYGDNLAGFKHDIQDAQAAGIDGFALNCGEWNHPGADWYYTNRVEMLYQAAEQLGTGFKFFFSVDETNTSEIVAMIESHANRPNSFRYQGKLVVSTSGQNSVDWENSVLPPLKQAGVDVFFVPYFLPENGAGYNVASISNLLSKYSHILDGLYYFAAGAASTITNCNQAGIQACRAAGKLFMAGYSPTYWGCAQPTAGRQYFETQGGQGTETEWMWIIHNQPDWVEISTWNDFNESTYCSPIPAPAQYEPELRTPARFSHAGYLDLSKYYIQWYKTGQPPSINQDTLGYFYRTHSTNAVATNDLPVILYPNNGPVADVIYTTTFLTSPAQLVVVSGNRITTNSVPAGLANQQTPFVPGPQKFILLRNNTPIISAQGPDIFTNITSYDYFPASGFAVALVPPVKLSVQQ